MAARAGVVQQQTLRPTSRTIVSDYVQYRVSLANPHWQCRGIEEDELEGPSGAADAPLPPDELETTIKRLSQEFEERYKKVFNEACGQIFVTPTSAQSQFMSAVQALFADGTNWGRVVALFAFSGTLAAQCVEKEMPGLVDHVVNWTAQYIDHNLTRWIDEHGGWNGLIEFYRNGSTCNGMSWPSFNTLCRAFSAIGVLTIGALLAHK